MIVNTEDIEWLNQFFPGLVVEVLPGSSFAVSGNFRFNAVYDSNNNQYLFNPESANYQFNVIEDSYNIEVVASSGRFPVVRDLDGRILSFAEKIGANPLDFHVYSRPYFNRNILCVAGTLDERNLSPSISLKEFVSRILLPFFYDNSHCEKYGTRPRAAYSHGAWGILENFFELGDYSRAAQLSCFAYVSKFDKDWNKITKYLFRKKSPKGHHICIFCGKRKIRNCHKRIFGALYIMHQGFRLSGGVALSSPKPTTHPMFQKIEMPKITSKSILRQFGRTIPKLV